MPVLPSSAKALRRDRRRQVVNYTIRARVRAAVADVVKGKATPQALARAYSLLDRAAKKRVIHPNKAARVKSSLSRLLTVSSQALSPDRKKSLRQTRS